MCLNLFFAMYVNGSWQDRARLVTDMDQVEHKSKNTEKMRVELMGRVKELTEVCNPVSISLYNV